MDTSENTIDSSHLDIPKRKPSIEFEDAFFTPRDGLSPASTFKDSPPVIMEELVLESHLLYDPYVRYMTPPPTEPPTDKLPMRPHIQLENHELRRLDALTRENLIQIIVDLIGCVPGPLPPSLRQVLVSSNNNNDASSVLSFSDLATTEVDVEEMVNNARTLSIPDYEELIPTLGKISEPRIYHRKSSLTSRIRRFSDLPPIPERQVPPPPSEAISLPSTQAVAITNEEDLHESHNCADHNNDLETVYGSVLSVSSHMDLNFHKHCSQELANIELYLADNLAPDARARFVPSIYANDMANVIDALDDSYKQSKWYRESIPVWILSTAGYSEDECEVFLRAKCMRTGIIGLVRLSQVIADNSNSTDKDCLEESYKSLWKLHPL